MTLVYESDLKIQKMHLHTENELPMSRLSKVRALRTGTLCLSHYVTETSHLHSLRDFWRYFGLCRAAAHSDCCFFVPCTNILTYLRTYCAILTKRKQKFAGSFARMDSILCELVVVISDSLVVLLLLLFFSCVVAVVIIIILFGLFCMAVSTTK